jgi:hypothetical protein
MLLIRDVVDMSKSNLAIVLPVKERDEKIVRTFIERHKDLLTGSFLIVIDSGGGKVLKEYASVYVEMDLPLWRARAWGICLIPFEYDFTLNLDVDTLLPDQYVQMALSRLTRESGLGVVSLDYETLQGHLSFGCSLFRTDLLKKLYDWTPSFLSFSQKCECTYMWGKVRRNGFRVETFNMRAVHLGSDRHG